MRHGKLSVNSNQEEMEGCVAYFNALFQYLPEKLKKT
jgi:hypothetical protein